jgi:hypothetical protein
MSTVTPAATFPVASPYDTTPSYSGTFIPAIWSKRLNTKFYANTFMTEITNTNYEGDIKTLGDKVIINNIPDVTISSYTVGSGLTYGVPTPSTVELPIDKGYSYAFQVNDVLAAQSTIDLTSTFLDDAAKQMKIQVENDFLFAQYNTGNAANKGATAGATSGAYNLGTDDAPVALSASTIIPLITGMASCLDEQNVPDDGRWLILPPFARNWLMQSPLAQAYVTGDPQSILRNGKIGRIDRFDIYVSNLLPHGTTDKAMVAAKSATSTGATATGALPRTAMLAGQTAAMTYASQVVKAETLKNPNDFGDLVRGLNVHGYQTIQDKALVLALVK